MQYHQSIGGKDGMSPNYAPHYSLEAYERDLDLFYGSKWEFFYKLSGGALMQSMGRS